MAAIQRVTEPTVAVLRVLIGTVEPIWGLRVIKSTGLKAGSVYPILGRLEEGGWLVGEWESAEERSGPRRRLYRLTSDGRREAAAVVAAYDLKAAQASAGVRGPRVVTGWT
jgi:PadR family transcriptional regulator PadR